MENQDDLKKQEDELQEEQHDAGNADATGDAKDNEMELDLSDDDEMKKMEALVDQKVEENKNTGSGKRGGNKGNKGNKDDNKDNKDDKGDNKEQDEKDKEKEKEKEKVDLSSGRILEREIKKGTVTCPQFRIVKIDDNSYDIFMAPELSLRTKELTFEKVGNSPKLVDAKIQAGVIASEKFGNEFIHKEGDKEFKHEWYRFEMHKPGRDKDVTEALKVAQAKATQADANKKAAKKAEDDAKKAAKVEEDKKNEEVVKGQEENKEQSA